MRGWVHPAQPPQEDLDRHYHDETHEHLLLFRSRFEKFESLITELHTKLQVRRHLVRWMQPGSLDRFGYTACGWRLDCRSTTAYCRPTDV